VAIQNARLFERPSEKEYFESLVENSPVAIVTLDLDFRIVSWNPAAEAVWLYAGTRS
jgi:PAS domain S-box-containing protein